jgi:hypothetical protein
MFSSRLSRMVEEVREFLRTLRWGGPTSEELQKFRVGTRSAGVLLGPEAGEYLNEYYTRGQVLVDSKIRMKASLDPLAPQPLRMHIAGVHKTQMNWFTDQIRGKGKPLYIERMGL